MDTSIAIPEKEMIIVYCSRITVDKEMIPPDKVRMIPDKETIGISLEIISPA